MASNTWCEHQQPGTSSMTGTNFKSETVFVGVVGKNQGKIQQLLDRAGYK
jgi:iron(III) transport system substrate-binding protein